MLVTNHIIQDTERHQLREIVNFFIVQSTTQTDCKNFKTNHTHNNQPLGNYLKIDKTQRTCMRITQMKQNAYLMKNTPICTRKLHCNAASN